MKISTVQSETKLHNYISERLRHTADVIVQIFYICSHISLTNNAQLSEFQEENSTN